MAMNERGIVKRLLLRFLFVSIFLLCSSLSFADADPSTVQVVAPKKESLQDKLVHIRIAEFDAINELESAKAEIVRYQKQLAATRLRFDDVESEDPVLSEQIGFYQVAYLLAVEQKKILEQYLKSQKELTEVWKNIFRLRTEKIRRSQFPEWQDQVKQKLAKLDQDEQLIALRISELDTDLKAVQERLSKTETLTEQRWIRKTEHALQKHLKILKMYEEDLFEIHTVTLQWDEEMRDALNRIPLGEYLKDALHYVLQVWSFEIARVDEHSINIGKILSALILFVLGIFLSRVLSRSVFKWLKNRFQLGIGASLSIQRLFFYFLVVLFSLAALRLVQVPLTVFAFLGGALALGVGFGSQNVVNNFISGLIMLIERPIKTGDYVDIEGILGVVEYIGMRSTRVKTPDNIHLVIPNSAFLEKNVINWTLSDQVIRAKVTVGVAYGSPTSKVRDLILEVIQAQDQILNHPEPVVFFEDFGDSALIFEAYFWVKIYRLMDRKRIESDLRYQIDEAFRKNDVVIAFPQRDVHLNATAPLDVRLLEPSTS